MRCLELMKSQVVLISGHSSAARAARLMREAGVGFLPVVDVHDRPIGTLTDRDLVVRLAGTDAPPEDIRVLELMSPEVVTCRPGDPAEVARTLMAKRRVARLVVVDAAGRVIGVISLSDIAKILGATPAGETLRAVAARETRPLPRP